LGSTFCFFFLVLFVFFFSFPPSTMPQMLNYVPFRFGLTLNWKRSFASSEPPSSFVAAWKEFQHARKEGFLLNGGWSGSYYMVENVLASVAQIPLLQKLESDEAKQTGGLMVKSTVTFAMQPFSQACTWAIISKEEMGPRMALQQMADMNVPLWNGADARALVV
jgi:hypothetical protein